MRTVKGTYGSRQTPADIFVYDRETVLGMLWKAVRTLILRPKLYEEGVDVELLGDTDCFTADPIESQEDLVREVNDYLED